MAKDNDSLSLAEMDELFSYISKMDKLAEQEPDDHSGDAWKQWQAEATALNEKYDAIIKKTLFAMSDLDEHPQVTTDVLKYYIAYSGRFNLQMYAEDPTISERAQAVRDAGKNLLKQPYVPLLNNAIFNAIFLLSFDDFKVDELADTDVGTYETDEAIIKISNFKELKSLQTVALKLWDATMAYVTFNNYNGDENPRSVAEIPLAEYAAVRKVNIKGRQNRREFKEGIMEAAHVLDRITITIISKCDDTIGNFSDVPMILNNPEIVGSRGNEIIRISLDEKMAKMLVGTGQIMRYAIMSLQGLDGRNPNNYPVARAVNLHASLYGNNKGGTDLTLTVKSLLSYAPYIISYDELKEQGREKAWRTDIKAKIEKVMNNFVKGGFWKQWQYRDPKTQNTITPDEITKIKMSWADYENLRVDYTLAQEMPTTKALEQLLSLPENVK